MKRKIIFSVFVIYIIQFVSSCCPNSGTFEVSYSEISGSTFVLENSTFVSMQPNVKVNKLDLLLDISMIEDLKQIASNFQKLSNFGFQKSYATSCPDNELVYLEDISTIKINQITTSNTKIDVTQNFEYKDFDNQFISIPEFVAQRETWQDGFILYLKNESDIENSAKFEIIITFTTDKVLSDITEEVQFN